MIRAIVFDCFGVLYRDNKALLYDLIAPDDSRKLQDIIHANDHGFLTRQEYHEAVAELANITVERIAEVDKQQFSRNSELMEYTGTLKPEYKLGLLSNVGQGMMDRLFTHAEQTELFDAFTLSSNIGVTKPAIAAFEAVVQALGVKPEETIMIDDIEENIAGARLAGMEALLFVSNQQLQRELPELLAKHA